jgi:hypothetical protein
MANSSIYTSLASFAGGVSLFGLKSLLSKQANIFLNSGLELIDNVITHVAPEPIQQVGLALEHMFSGSCQATSKAILALRLSEFYTDQTVKELNGFLNEGMAQMKMGSEINNVARVCALAGVAFIGYGLYKAVQYCRTPKN